MLYNSLQFWTNWVQVDQVHSLRFCTILLKLRSKSRAKASERLFICTNWVTIYQSLPPFCTIWLVSVQKNSIKAFDFGQKFSRIVQNFSDELREFKMGLLREFWAKNIDNSIISDWNTAPDIPKKLTFCAISGLFCPKTVKLYQNVFYLSGRLF